MDVYSKFIGLFDGFDGDQCEVGIQEIESLIQKEEHLTHSPFFCMVSNLKTGNYEHVGRHMPAYLGFERVVFETNGLWRWIKNIHPEEIEVWSLAIGDLMEYAFKEIPSSKIKDVKFTLNYRIRRSDGSFANVVEHMRLLRWSSVGNPLVKASYISVIADNQNLPVLGGIRLLDENGEYQTLFNKNYSQENLFNSLSKRENEIAKLLVKRLNSKRIGELLNISSHTVDTHRRNILGKLKIQSTGELLNFASPN